MQARRRWRPQKIRTKIEEKKQLRLFFWKLKKEALISCKTANFDKFPSCVDEDEKDEKKLSTFQKS
jgi:hypothetical protein